jgi:flagellar biosynthesis GTPase FlhF
MKPADLLRVSDRFARFRPNKLLFTRLDETSSFGPIWAESVRLAKPLSFFSNGPEIPENLQEATPDSFAELLLGGFDAVGAQSASSDESTCATASSFSPELCTPGNEAAA